MPKPSRVPPLRRRVVANVNVDDAVVHCLRCRLRAWIGARCARAIARHNPPKIVRR